MLKKLLIIMSLLVWAHPDMAGQTPALSDEEMDRRLTFIEQRLNAGRASARYWQYGWSGFYAASTTFQGALAIRSKNADNEANYTVGALKSAGGLALMLLRPLPGVKGADPLQAM
ncbi:MAG: hypothetical protein JJV98_12730, partial [Desulfosarcina sp.]|nr:hypothetical protein [Desulfobacterales bacterium]